MTEHGHKTQVNSSADTPVFFSKEAISAIPAMLISKVLTICLYIPISMLVVRGLGPKNFGIYSLCQNIAEYLVVICGLGLNVAILRFIPELIVKSQIVGLKRLLLKSAFLELIMSILCTLVLISLADILSKFLNFNFSPYAVLVGLVIFSLLGKEFFNNSLTALYQAYAVAILSFFQGAVFLSLLIWIFFSDSLTVKTALTFQAISFLAQILISSFLLLRNVNSIKCASVPHGIGKRRVLNLSLPVMLDTLLNKLNFQYSEIFFLGYFLGPEPVGYFALGFSLSMQLITIIPQSLHTLLSSAFSETYSKNADSISDLMEGTFVLLITICLPIASFGAFFFIPACEIIYGANMRLAGVVGSVFCGIHFLTLFSIPLSFAIVAKEKTLNALWLTFSQLAINLTVDYFLIKYLGLWGAVLAVATNFFLSLPLRIIIVRWIVGGIYFPFFFFLRFALLTISLAALLWAFIPIHGIFSLVFTGLLYGISLLALIKFTGCIRENDIKHFKSIGIKKINRWLDFLSTPLRLRKF